MKENPLRLFIAASLPPDLLAFFLEQSTGFAAEDWRVVPAANLHLTLFFIGNVPAHRLTEIQNKTRQLAAAYSSFTLQPEQLEAGPNSRQPRLIWARFRQHPTFRQLALALQNEITPDAALPKQQIPHVTLARRRKEVLHVQPFPPVTPPNLLTLPVTEIGIWQSVLGQPHPVYSVLETFPLQPNHALHS